MKGIVNILDFDLEKLRAWCISKGEPPYRGDQIFKWIFQNRCFAFTEMTDLPVKFRKYLEKSFNIAAFTLEKKVVSADGSIKYLFRLYDGVYIEAVYLPQESHYTICVSSQVGCALGCRFCATGQMGIMRNLTTSEIICQILYILKDMRIHGRSNIVFMGMGEPLLNLEHVSGAISILTSKKVGEWSSRRITVSTVGIIPELKRLARIHPHIRLAISLNAPDERVRSRLMPINKKYPLNVLIPVLKKYPLPTQSHRITFEYIMIKGMNDSEEHAVKLARLLRGIRCIINLIPMNEVSGCRYRSSPQQRILSFQGILMRSGYLVRIRKSMGSDIRGSCGQLAQKSFNKETASDSWHQNESKN